MHVIKRYEHVDRDMFVKEANMHNNGVSEWMREICAEIAVMVAW